jgi:phosphoribosylformylglycinamidine (FGAM) synthase-like enzyme
MSYTEELRAAMTLCRQAGYSVLPREAIQTVGATFVATNAELARYGSADGFMTRIRHGLAHEIAKAIETNPKFTNLETRRGADLTVFEVRFKVVEYEKETDPILALLREDQLRPRT